MSTLTTQLRNKLERTVIDARELAEAGAKDALQLLAVHHHEPYAQMSPEQRKLRNHLRARARQLGDRHDRQGRLDMGHVVQECAYEYWHRMLFARFLAENDLLIDSDMGVPITLAECEELARDAGKDKWVYASRCAQDMLPQIFRPDDPLLQVPFAANHRIQLERLLDGLTPDTFTATDAIGWVYQFWQSKKKDEVNASGNKIGADELPAVTQLFTEDYMVDFLLDNTLGAWWVGKVEAASSRLSECKTEEECRRAFALPGCEWKYLRFVKVEAASSRLSYFDPREPIENLTGNLPHWRQDAVTYFVTFRCADSLPQEKLDQWHEEMAAWLKEHPEPHDEATRKEFYDLFPQRIQNWLDAGYGRCLLKRTQHKECVENALKHFDGDRYTLDEFVVAANHVHVLVTSRQGHKLSDILHSWKSFTANQINAAESLAGTFWQKESFDHIVRNEKSLHKFREYIREHKVDATSSRVDEGKRLEAASTFRPAVGTYDGWPKTTAELKCLDPCCGSGHFLVAMLERLVPMRMAEEGLSKADAVRAVLRDNIHGLEIDPRCTQLAAFALALAAWKMITVDAASSRVSPQQIQAARLEAASTLNIACCGLEIGGTKEEWCALAPGNNFIMNQVYDLFRNASTLGSLIDPASQVKTGVGGPDIGSLKDSILPGLEAFREDQDFVQQELGVSGGGVLDAYALLSERYHLVATNVPYLGFGRQDEILQAFTFKHHPLGKADLATCFVERCLQACSSCGVFAGVTPHNWLFLRDYKQVRKHLLVNETWLFSVRLGAGAFETISGEVVKPALIALKKQRPPETSSFAATDASGASSIDGKREALLGQTMNALAQRDQLKNPNHVITSEALVHGQLLQAIAPSYEGAKTVDIERFRHFFWELPAIREDEWWYHNSSPKGNGLVSGCHYVSANRSAGSAFAENIKAYEDCGRKVVAWLCGQPCWGKLGVSVAWMNDLPASLYLGSVFDNSAAVLLPKVAEDLLPLYCFVESGAYTREVRKINQKVQVAAGSLDQVPFDLDHWRAFARSQYPDGLPTPYSDDPTEWLFSGQPRESLDPLQAGMGRLLGYLWPRQNGASFLQCPTLPADHLFDRSDLDGIVCIPSVRGEDPAADRLLALLRKAYGDDWTDTKVRELIAATGSKAKSLDDWLRNDFFELHCKLFHHRPFIWHIWDGRKRDGFHALVNYHKLAEGNGEGRKVLEKLTHSYLGEWITRQKDGVARGEGGAEDRLAAAVELQNRLLAILRGEPPFDIFVRWKPLHQQAIGWNPDINDGVRLNIRPFMASDLPGGKKGAGILRWKPNIKWGKDRGKEPHRPKDEYPWFWSWDESTQDFTGGAEFDGNRWNDLHYTNAAKEAARERFTAEDTKENFQ